jgi:carbonic anhydrase
MIFIYLFISPVTDNLKFEAFIDPDNKFGPNDKFSQVNALTQLENLKYYKFLREPLDEKKINVHALWLDIYCGDVYAFSFMDKCFMKLDESTYEHLLSSVNLKS